MYSVSLCAVLQPLAAHAHPRLFLRLESTERCQVCKWAPGRLSLQTHLWARRSWFFLVRGDSRIGEGCCRLHPLCPTRSLTPSPWFCCHIAGEFFVSLKMHVTREFFREYTCGTPESLWSKEVLGWQSNFFRSICCHAGRLQKSM